ncbi:MAG: sulfotransferase [Ktedonobacteraceae bacterium]|nr:sulfotransferase [Ktedonobacteraceae bacterium]
MYSLSDSGTPVFIVGTGRCGSTMLSTMLRDHPAILSLSEFFTFVTDLGTRIPQAFPAGFIDGEQFWRLLSTHYPKQNIMVQHGIAMDEVLYPYTSSHARYNAQTGIPAILQTTLPHLTPEHDRLFDDLQAFVLTLPPAPIHIQYQHLFGWLQRRFNRQCWVERSGSSLRVVARLRQHFPNARFVHIVRDGRDCALSMSRHYGFRMVLIAFYLMEVLGCDPYEDQDRSGAEDLPDDLYSFLPEHFEAEAFRSYEIAPSLYGHYWSGELQQGLATLAEIPEESILTLHFEDFFSDAERSLRKLISFINPAYVDESWLHYAASLVRPVRSAWQTLPPLEQKQLDRACQVGFEALEAFRRRSLSAIRSAGA